MATDASDLSESVPPGVTPASCSHCGRAFPTERIRDLHCGFAHYADLDESGQERFERARDAEASDLRSFQLRALAALVVLYFGFLFTYALVS